MSWTPDEQRAVATALLGSWPATLAQLGQEAIAAYIGELEARGLEAPAVLLAIRTWPAGSDFPPAAPNLAAAARRGPDRLTFAEAFTLIYGRGGALKARPKPGRYDNEAQMIGARHDAARERAYELNPLLGAFVDQVGIERLWSLPINDEEFGSVRRRELEQQWDQFLEVSEHRDAVALVSATAPELVARGPRRLTPQAMAPPAADQAPPEDSACGGISQ